MSKNEKKGKEKKRDEKEPSLTKHLQEETLQGIIAVLFFVLAIFLSLSAFEKGGPVGAWIFDKLKMLVGMGYYLLPILFFILAISFLSLANSSADITACPVPSCLS